MLVVAVAVADPINVRQMIGTARTLNPAIEIVVRVVSDDECALLRHEADSTVFLGEEELAKGMSRHVLARFAADPAVGDEAKQPVGLTKSAARCAKTACFRPHFCANRPIIRLKSVQNRARLPHFGCADTSFSLRPNKPDRLLERGCRVGLPCCNNISHLLCGDTRRLCAFLVLRTDNAIAPCRLGPVQGAIRLVDQFFDALAR